MNIKEIILFDKKMRAISFYSEHEQMIGLQAVTLLPQDMCAIFYKDKAENVSFHMGTVAYPIDIVFLLNDKVVKIVHYLKPNSKERYSAYSDCIIEFNGGYCKRNNINLNDLAWTEKNMTN